MLWRALLCLLFAGAINAVPGTIVYKVRSRSLTALNQVANQYAGIMINAELAVQLQNENSTISAQLVNPVYAQIHSILPDGWQEEINEGKLSFKPLPTRNDPFEMRLDSNKIIKEVLVSGNTTDLEANMLKGIMSQLQLNTQAVNLVSNRQNNLPRPDSNSAQYSVMESIITGECEVLYDVSPVPAAMLHAQPMLAPYNNGSQPILQIFKTQNFSNCNQRPVYHFGFEGFESMQPGANVGTFMSRTSTSRVIISGSLERFVVQSAVTTNKIVVSPELYNNQKGIAVSSVNVTLQSIATHRDIPPVGNPRSVGDLVYFYNKPNINQPAALKKADCVSFFANSSSSEEAIGQRKPNRRGDVPPFIVNLQEKMQNASRSRRSLRLQLSNYGSSSDTNEEFNRQSRQAQDSAASVNYLVYFVGVRGNNGRAEENRAGQILIKLAREVARDLENPDTLVDENTLSKFNNMKILADALNSSVLDEVTRALHTSLPQNPNLDDNIKMNAWKAFRDSVAYAGTLSALYTIRNWIQNDIISGNEAAEIMSVLARSALIPTQDYIELLFEIVKDQKTKVQPFLNSSAVLAFADTLRNVAVNRQSSKLRYPIYVYGPMVPKTFCPLTSRYMPYLANELQEAINEGNSPKIQVYIRALGKIAHPNILHYFEPYIEGRSNVSSYQRLLMVIALNHLAKLHPDVASPVLLGLYENLGEAPQIRTAAVSTLMETNPSVTILQRIAEFTHVDTNREVKAVVVSAIKSAAEMEGPYAQQMAQNARAAVHFLTPMQLEPSDSKVFKGSYLLQNIDLGYRQDYIQYGSRDHILPRALFHSLVTDMGGETTEPVDMEWIISSVRNTLDLMKEQFEEIGQTNHKSGKNSNHKQSGHITNDDVARMLGIVNEYMEQVEGNVAFNFAGGQRFFPFDNQTLQSIPSLVKLMAQLHKNPLTVNYTKFHDRNTRVLAFPNAMGFPFLYSLRMPSLLRLSAKSTIRSQPDLAQASNKMAIPQVLNISTSMRLVHTFKIESMIGFFTPFDCAMYVAGLDRDLLYNIALNAKLNVDIPKRNISLIMRPMSDKNIRMVQTLTRPYTAVHSILKVSSILGGENTNLIRMRPAKQINRTVGQEMGIFVRVNTETEEEFVDFKSQSDSASVHDIPSSIYFSWASQSILYNNMTVTFDPHLSTAKVVKITAVYDNNNNINHTSQNEAKGYGNFENQLVSRKTKQIRVPRHIWWQSREETDFLVSNPAIPQTSTSADCSSRRQEYLNNAASTVKHASAAVIDLSVKFEGKTRAEFVMTAALASSLVNGSQSVLLFMKSQPARQAHHAREHQLQACLFGKVAMPPVPITNLRKAIKLNQHASVMATLSFGETCQNGATVTLQGKMEQSRTRKQSIANSSMAKLCEAQMNMKNNLLPACRYITRAANNLDQLDFTIKYDHIPDLLKNSTYRLYGLARHWLYPYITENIYPEDPEEDAIHVTAKLNEESSALNVTMETPTMNVNITDVRLNRWARTLLNINPQHTLIDRIGNDISPLYYSPTCVIDSSMVNTFDNVTYPLHLGKCWHVVLTVVPKRMAKPSQQQDQHHAQNSLNTLQEISVSVREVGKNKEVMILLNSASIILKPSLHSNSAKAATVTINDLHVDVESCKWAPLCLNGELLAYAFIMPDDALHLMLPDKKLVVAYDGLRVMLQATNIYRDQVRGLCGNMDGEPFNDFKTPNNHLVMDPSVFTATYAIDKDSCQSPKINEEVNRQAFVQERINFADVIPYSQPESASQRGFNIANFINVSSSLSTPSTSDQNSRSDSSSNSSSSSSSESQEIMNSNSPANLDNKIIRSSKNQESGLSYRIMIILNDDEACFSTKPLPVCSVGYNATVTEEEAESFYCIHDQSLIERYVKMVEIGVNLDFRSETKIRRIVVPTPVECALGRST